MEKEREQLPRDERARAASPGESERGVLEDLRDSMNEGISYAAKGPWSALHSGAMGDPRQAARAAMGVPGAALLLDNSFSDDFEATNLVVP